MTIEKSNLLLERQLLLQLGDRLKRLRKTQRLGTVELAARAGMTRPLHNLADHPAEARIMLILSRFA